MAAAGLLPFPAAALFEMPLGEPRLSLAQAEEVGPLQPSAAEQTREPPFSTPSPPELAPTGSWLEEPQRGDTGHACASDDHGLFLLYDADDAETLAASADGLAHSHILGDEEIVRHQSKGGEGPDVDGNYGEADDGTREEDEARGEGGEGFHRQPEEAVEAAAAAETPEPARRRGRPSRASAPVPGHFSSEQRAVLAGFDAAVDHGGDADAGAGGDDDADYGARDVPGRKRGGAAAVIRAPSPSAQRPPPASRKRSRGEGISTSSREPPLRRLLDAGVLVPGPACLSVRYRDRVVFGDLMSDGTIEEGGRRFQAPSSFSLAIKQDANPQASALKQRSESLGTSVFL